MSIASFLEEEVLEKKRTALYSYLVRKYPDSSVLDEISRFLENHSQAVSLIISQSNTGEDGSHVISLTCSDKFSDRIFAIRPKDSNETFSSVFRRDREDIKAEMTERNNELWTPRHALITPSQKLEMRDIKAPMVSPTPNKPSISVNKPAPIGVPSRAPSSNAPASVVSKPVVANPVSVAKKPVVAPPVKFQVPLDRLDDMNDGFVEKKNIEEESVKENSFESADPSPPQVALTVSSSSVSPAPKRPRTEEPEYREVTIKKKVLVTEYEMGPNGEMVVKDVEKMVEETRMELVKPSSQQPATRTAPSSGSSGKKDPPKPAKPGQGTLTGFFKPKN